MTDFQHETPHDDAPLFGAAEFGDAPPTATALLFRPVATAPAKTADEALAILADEVAALAEREEALHQERADLSMSDPAFATLGTKAASALDMIKMKWTLGRLVRPDTHAGLVAKARLILPMRSELENCEVPEAPGFLLSMAEDVVRLAGQSQDQLWAAQDATVIHAAAEVRRLSAANDAAWHADPELDDECSEQIAWKARADEASALFNDAVAHLASLDPRTPVGMAAKASAVPSLTSFRDFVRDWSEWDLVHSLAADAQRIGAALAPLPADAELLALGAELEHLWGAEEEAAQGDDATADAAVDRTRAIIDAIVTIQPTTLAGAKVRARAVAWGFNGEISQGAGTGPQLLHRFMSDMGALEAVPLRKPADASVPNVEVGLNTGLAPSAPDRFALESYRTWLEREHRALTHEMYPGQPDAVAHTYLNNPGGRFHFRGEPPASSRAERILAAVGVDWRNDPVAERDRQHEQAA